MTGDDAGSTGDGARTTYTVGDELPTRSHTVTRQDIARYGGASGDFNRPHVDEPFAIEAGFDSVIAMGMLTAGFGGSAAHEWFGVDALRSYTVRFEDVVYPGEELTVCGSIVDRDGDVVVAEVTVVTAAGKEVLSGTVEALRT